MVLDGHTAPSSTPGYTPFYNSYTMSKNKKDKEGIAGIKGLDSASLWILWALVLHSHKPTYFDMFAGLQLCLYQRTHSTGTHFCCWQPEKKGKLYDVYFPPWFDLTLVLLWRKRAAVCEMLALGF